MTRKIAVTTLILAVLSIAILFFEQSRNAVILEPINKNIKTEDFNEYIKESAPAAVDDPTKIEVENETAVSDGKMTPAQKRIAEQLTSLFENGKTELQYGYAEDLGDGRGITAGRAGFTTSDGDAYEVVRLYTQAKPDNKLAKYLATLKKLADEGSDSTKKLKDYENAWGAAAGDSLFRQTQDFVSDKLYYEPSQKHADTLGLQTALGRTILYDTIIQHGDGSDNDSLGALIKKTISKVGGTPKSGVSETKWLTTFLEVRKADLLNPDEEDTQDEWEDSVDRVTALQQILQSGNLSLTTPISVKTGDFTATLK